MPDNFQGTKDIILQPGDTSIPYTFEVTVCSSATANDGTLPYGTSISSVVVTGHVSETGTVVTSEIINSSSETNNVISVLLKYPATSGEGWYHLKFVCTLSSGAVKELDFARIYAEDR